MPILIGAYYIAALIMAVHCVRSGRPMYWLFFLFALPPVGLLVYALTQWLPDVGSGKTGRKARQAVTRALNPEGDYRAALAALEDVASPGNYLRLGHAAFAHGRFEEAEQAYRAVLRGQFADDPAALLGHARTLLELGRPGEALTQLEALKALGKEGETAEVAMHTGRALEALGRVEEAEAPYRYAADRFAGLEAGGRYVAFLARTGRLDDARIGLGELDRRLARTPSDFRAEARRWRDHAAEAVAKTSPGAPLGRN